VHRRRRQTHLPGELGIGETTVSAQQFNEVKIGGVHVRRP
jgi:hypothetical protein